MRFTIETEQEVDGRWIAEVRELSGVLAYGRTRDEAITKVEALGLRVLADRLENNAGGAHLSAPDFLRRTMSEWPSAKARQVIAALLRIGWTLKRDAGSHRVLSRPGWPDLVFAFHEREEISPRMLSHDRQTDWAETEDLLANDAPFDHPLPAPQHTANPGICSRTAYRSPREFSTIQQSPPHCGSPQINPTRSQRLLNNF